MSVSKSDVVLIIQLVEEMERLEDMIDLVSDVQGLVVRTTKGIVFRYADHAATANDIASLLAARINQRVDTVKSQIRALGLDVA